jgi:hypothetical protein
MEGEIVGDFLEKQSHPLVGAGPLFTPFQQGMSAWGIVKKALFVMLSKALSPATSAGLAPRNSCGIKTWSDRSRSRSGDGTGPGGSISYSSRGRPPLTRDFAFATLRVTDFWDSPLCNSGSKAPRDLGDQRWRWREKGFRQITGS